MDGAAKLIARILASETDIEAQARAIAAALGDCGVPTEIMRGFAMISRRAGLVGHVHEEQHKPAMRAIWEAADAAVAYDGEAGKSE